jgi:putative membrane protein
MEIARRKGINVDPSSTVDQQQVASKLTSLTGPEFDRAYTDAMVQAHQSAVQLFEDVSHTGDDPDLKAFAAGRSDAVKAQVATYRARGPLP